MKRILVYILTLSMCISLFSQEKVPEWFKKLPGKSADLSVGYTGQFLDKQLARDVALYHAYKSLAKQQKVRLIFELKQFSDGTYRLIQPTFQQIYYENILSQVKEQSIPLDSCFLQGRYFILLGYDHDKEFKINGDTVNWGTKPEWVNSLPASEDYVYGLGMVANYSSWKNGWQDADEYARFAACKNLRVKASSIRKEKQVNGLTTLRSISRQAVDTSIYNTKIIKRWYDLERDIFYSLCRAPQK